MFLLFDFAWFLLPPCNSKDKGWKFSSLLLYSFINAPLATFEFHCQAAVDYILIYFQLIFMSPRLLTFFMSLLAGLWE